MLGPAFLKTGRVVTLLVTASGDFTANWRDLPGFLSDPCLKIDLLGGNGDEFEKRQNKNLILIHSSVCVCQRLCHSLSKTGFSKTVPASSTADAA